MGCGKSTMGRKLARQLQFDFVDLDKQIEQETGMGIVDYFGLHGEDKFRQLERDILQKTDFSANEVIATGGGTPCYFDNMVWMNQHGQTVYLSMDPKALANRLINSKSERPLIKGLNYDQLLNFITLKLGSREAFYHQARFIVSAADLTAEKLAGYLNSSSA